MESFISFLRFLADILFIGQIAELFGGKRKKKDEHKDKT
jgi:hypothetical protein